MLPGRSTRQFPGPRPVVLNFEPVDRLLTISPTIFSVSGLSPLGSRLPSFFSFPLGQYGFENVLSGSMALPELVVGSLLCQQLVVGALLGDRAVFQDYDTVGHASSAQAVGNDQRRLA